MNPAEAGQYDEPDWAARFDDECSRQPKLPRYLREEDAFKEILRQWRHFYAAPAPVGQRVPRPATEAIIALAGLGIFAPRSTWRDLPRAIATGYQHDDHCWMQSGAGEQWRITAIEDRMLHLEKMSFDDKVETKQVDLNTAKWEKYTETAVAVLEAMRC